MNKRIIDMELEKMYNEYVSYVNRYKKIIEVVDELMKDKSIEGFQLAKYERAIETVVFSLKYENHEVKGKITLKEIYVFLEEKNYSDDLIKQGICDFILKRAKDAFIARLYEKK